MHTSSLLARHRLVRRLVVPGVVGLSLVLSSCGTAALSAVEAEWAAVVPSSTTDPAATAAPDGVPSPSTASTAASVPPSTTSMPSPSVVSATSTLPTESAPTPTPTPTPTPDPAATSAPAPATAPQAPAISALPAALEDDVRDCERYEEDWMTNGHLYECLKGSRVRQLQEALIRWNTGVALEADGHLGATTQRALLTWQFQRGWPAPTTTLEKYRTIERLVLVDPSAPGVDVTGPCPVWIDTEVTAESLGSRPNDLWPILQLCDQGEAVRDFQFQLAAAGFPVAQDGRYGLDMARAVAAYETELYGVPSTGDAVYFDTFTSFWS